MIRSTAIALVLAAFATTACQPQKTPEQLAAEQQAAALKSMMEALGGMSGMSGEMTINGQQVDPEKMAAAIAQAGNMASMMDREISPEDRAKLQAVTGALQSGQVHPAAQAWIGGANQALAILKNVKDVPSANAAKAQLAPIYAAMVGPTATLEAMSEDERDVAMGSALPQFMSFGMNAASLMIPLSSNPELANLVEDMLEDMPSPD